MISKIPRLGTLTRAAMFIIMPLVASILMYFKMDQALRLYVESRAAQDAGLAGTIVQRELTACSESLSRIADYFQDGRVPEDQMENVINWILKKPGRLSSGILRLDGSQVAGDALLPSEYPAIKSAFHGNSAVRYREGEGFLFTCPVYNGKNIKYVLYELFDVYSLFDGFEQSVFDGSANISLADSSQQKTISFSRNAQTDYLYDESNQDVYVSLHEKMGIGTAAAVYDDENGEYIWFTTDIPNSNFYLIGRVPYSEVAENVNGLAFMALLIFIMLLILLAIGTFRTVTASAKLKESEELRRAKQIAEEASRSKSQFLANMSHELRTPINVILGMDEMILREERSEKTRERAMDIRSAASILMSLINDVLDFSKIESGKMNVICADYSLVALIRDLVLMTENRIRQKSLTFKIEIAPDLPVMLNGDDIHIRQVIMNLLTNAVKYTNDGTVTFKMSGMREDSGKIIIRCAVTDTGIGIKQEDIDKLMIPYTRIEEERNRTVEGTGLGMSIIINLLKLMNSQLNIESVYGQGSTFWFDLEQTVVSEEEIGDIVQRINDIAKDYEYKAAFTAPDARVLMVDDNSMNRKIFVGLLEQTQIGITTAASGEKCLELVQNERYDIIFMDHFMPGMDGIETLERLKEMDGNLSADAPVIALTANAFSGDREKYIEMGFDEFLSKPISTDKLEALIKKLLPPELIKDAPAMDAEPQTEQEEFPAVEGVNRDLASLHFKKKDMFVSILRDFYRNVEKEQADVEALAEKVKQSFDEDALAAYRIKVHSLKSTSAMVGIMSVSELAKMLEFAARDGDVKYIERLSPFLYDEMKKTRDRLHSFFGDDDKPSDAADSNTLAELLQPLSEALENMDIEGADTSMAKIEKYVYPDGLDEKVRLLSDTVNALDYSGAGEIIEELQEMIQQNG